MAYFCSQNLFGSCWVLGLPPKDRATRSTICQASHNQWEDSLIPITFTWLLFKSCCQGLIWRNDWSESADQHKVGKETKLWAVTAKEICLLDITSVFKGTVFCLFHVRSCFPIRYKLQLNAVTFHGSLPAQAGTDFLWKSVIPQILGFLVPLIQGNIVWYGRSSCGLFLICSQFTLFFCPHPSNVGAEIVCYFLSLTSLKVTSQEGSKRISLAPLLKQYSLRVP